MIDRIEALGMLGCSVVGMAALGLLCLGCYAIRRGAGR